jgi:hypothetical protein
MRRWILRPLAWLSAGLVVVTALLAGAIRLDQYVLRWRAERLQSDIRSLELRKSTYADARRFEDRWFDNTEEKVCRQSWCDLQVFFENTGRRHVDFLANHPAVFALYHKLGGRVAGVYSYIQIRDNVLWGKGISLTIETLETESDGRHVEYQLEASVGTDDRFTWVSARHPEYQIGRPTGCTGCRLGWVKFTPFADPKDVLRLTDLNFTCLTRWRHCTHQEDILPTAWKELKAENTGDWWVQPCTPAMIRVFSRKTHYIDLAKVIKLDLKEQPLPSMTVRRLSRVPFELENWWPEFSLFMDPTSNVRVGDKLLLIEGGWVPATAENMKAARLGASEGWINPAHPLPLPFGEINPAIRPPKIDLR